MNGPIKWGIGTQSPVPQPSLKGKEYVARIRTIKPEFWSDERVAECSPSARLLFVGTWNYADDRGNLPRGARQLKAQIFPYDSFECEPLILELITHQLLIEYTVDGTKYLHIKNFLKHQKIDKPAKVYTIPEPFDESSESPRGALAPEGRKEGREGKEGKGREGVAPLPVRAEIDDFTELEYAKRFWDEMGVPCGKREITLAGQAILLMARDGHTHLRQAMETIIERATAARASGATINGFWFTDGRHLKEAKVKPTVQEETPSQYQARLEREAMELIEAERAAKATVN